MTATVLSQVTQVLKLVVEIRQEPLDSRQEFRAYLTKLQATCGSVEQSHIQFVLQLPN